MKNKKKIQEDAARTEREIRRERKFSLAEAVGREAAGALKGASPVAPARQVLLEIENILETGLRDPEGSLLRTLLARLKNNPALLADHFGDAPGALRSFLAPILASRSTLDTLVRDTDARWGREFQEKPIFDRPGHPVRTDDPYTPGSVAASLQELLDRLKEVPD